MAKATPRLRLTPVSSIQLADGEHLAVRVPADLLQQVTEALGAQGLTIRTILKGGKDVAQVERIPNWLLERGELCKHGNHWAEPCPRCKASFQT